MTIGTVVQRGPIIYIYDEHRNQISTITAGSGADCRLEGYTSSTVSVRRGKSFSCMTSAEYSSALLLMVESTCVPSD
jgi:hypothetical protein